MRTEPEVTMSQTSRFGSQRLYRDAGSMATYMLASLVMTLGIVAASVRSQVEQLPEVVARPAPEHLPAFSVVVCTRDRPDNLTDVLKALTALDYPEFELLVVDNNPQSGLTPPVGDAFDLPIQ